MHLSLLDIFMMLCYLAFLMGTAQLAAAKAGHSKGFSGSGWWFIGIALLLSGLSAEQILGLGGAAYAMGITVATYDWTAAIALFVIAKYLLPIFHRNHIASVQDFLYRRYGPEIQMLMAGIWLSVIIFVKLTTILWLGATALNAITGISHSISLILIGLFAGNYALYVGLNTNAFGNLIQVVTNLLAGVIVVCYALPMVAGEASLADGIQRMVTNLPAHFHMVLPPDNPNYIYAPGLGMLLGGMWVLHFAYWGANQTIFRRATECDTVERARTSLMIIAAIKLLFPFLVVLPGIIALQLMPGLDHPDAAIPMLLTKLPHGLLGFIFSSLLVSIVISMGSELSQIAAILSHDLFDNPRLRLPEKKRQIVSQTATALALVIAILITQPLLGDIELAFMYLQEMMGFVAPAILTLFLFGFIWRGANQAGALASTIGTLLLSALAKIFWPALPFIHRIGLVFLCAALLMVITSRLFRAENRPSPLSIAGTDFHASAAFHYAALALVLLLGGLYAFLW